MNFINGVEAKIADLKEKYSLKCTIPSLKVGNKSAQTGIVQGGMGVGISLSGLASAVANEGCVGVIAANAIGMIEPDYFHNHIEANVRALRKEIKKSREAGNGLIGVNIMVAVDCFAQLLETAIEEKVDALFLGAGLPIKNIPVEKIRAAGVAVFPIVSSGRAARLIFKSWEKMYKDIPDGVVVEGPQAGGHLGFKYDQINSESCKLEVIVPEVVEALLEFQGRFGKEIPVIAAGGIFSGEDIYRFFKLGAKGVQMGTRFVATHECDADIRFKDAYVKAKEEDVTIISSPVGLPGRAINNRFLKEVLQGMKKNFRCPSKCLESCGAKDAQYCISEALDNARKGDLDNGFAFAGSNVHKVGSITSVKELISTLRNEYTIAAFYDMLKTEYDKMADKLAAKKEEYSTVLSTFSSEVQESLRKTTLENEIKFKQKMESMSEFIEQTKSEYNAMLNKFYQLSEDIAILNSGKFNLSN
ncbi:MAG TPA: nitronate monooxygenase [bacterium]|nr:nitronate monooxygenase [bacterium]